MTRKSRRAPAVSPFEDYPYTRAMLARLSGASPGSVNSWLCWVTSIGVAVPYRLDPGSPAYWYPESVRRAVVKQFDHRRNRRTGEHINLRVGVEEIGPLPEWMTQPVGARPPARPPKPKPKPSGLTVEKLAEEFGVEPAIISRALRTEWPNGIRTWRRDPARVREVISKYLDLHSEHHKTPRRKPVRDSGPLKPGVWRRGPGGVYRRVTLGELNPAPARRKPT